MEKEDFYWKIVNNEVLYCKKVGEKIADDLYILNYKGKFGITNENLHFISPPIYDELFLAFPNYFWAKLNGVWNLINRNGHFIIKKNFKKVSVFTKAIASVSYDGKIFGFINKTGDFIIPPNFGKGKFLGSGFFAVSKIMNENNDQKKYFNLNGELVKFGIIDEKGTLVYPYILDKIPEIEEVRELVLKKNNLFFEDRRTE